MRGSKTRAAATRTKKYGNCELQIVPTSFSEFEADPPNTRCFFPLVYGDVGVGTPSFDDDVCVVEAAAKSSLLSSVGASKAP